LTLASATAETQNDRSNATLLCVSRHACPDRRCRFLWRKPPAVYDKDDDAQPRRMLRSGVGSTGFHWSVRFHQRPAPLRSSPRSSRGSPVEEPHQESGPWPHRSSGCFIGGRVSRQECAVARREWKRRKVCLPARTYSI